MKRGRVFLTLSALLLSGCTPQGDERLSLLVPSGAPFLSMAGVASEVDTEVTIGPDLLPVTFIKGEKDLIIAPLTVGARLYNSGQSNYQLEAVLGWSNLYLLSRTTITEIDDLEGKSVLAFGEHATPGIMLRLATAHLTIEYTYFKSVSDVVGPFLTGLYDYVLMSEPILSKAISTTTNEVYVYDLQLIDRLPRIAQFGLFVHPEAKRTNVDDFTSKLALNITELNKNTEAYVDRIITIDSQFSELGKDVLIASIPRLALDYVSAQEAKLVVDDFFSYLIDADPALIGEHQVDEDFYG